MQLLEIISKFPKGSYEMVPQWAPNEKSNGLKRDAIYLPTQGLTADQQYIAIWHYKQVSGVLLIQV